MSTVIRTELSAKNPYHISKHRMLELKHFCLQYEEWRKEYEKICVLRSYEGSSVQVSDISDRTSRLGMRAAELKSNMELVKTCAQEAGDDIWTWLFEAVVYGYSFPELEGRGIPCGRDYYYIRYRRFFWVLDKRRS